MRVSDSRRVLFVHVPKNAGSTIDGIFDREVGDARRVEGRARHARYGSLLNSEPALGDYWSFGFVRNPWARMVSWYSMMSGIFANESAGVPRTLAKIAKHPAVWEPVRPLVVDFETFVMEGTVTVPRFGRPQLDWLETGRGRRVDFIGRVESFSEDLEVVRKELGLAPLPKVPRRNKSSHGHYSDYYTPALRERVAEVFAKDIEEFGYTFDHA